MNNHRTGRQPGNGEPPSTNRTLHYVALAVLVVIVIALVAVMR